MIDLDFPLSSACSRMCESKLRKTHTHKKKKTDNGRPFCYLSVPALLCQCSVYAVTHLKPEVALHEKDGTLVKAFLGR